jgi:hypothetical protein
MIQTAQKAMRLTLSATFVLAAVSSSCLPARAGEKEAKDILKAMSDYLAEQKAISFSYDTNLEVVTKDHQKLLLASSGKIDVGRPDKIRASRSGGFANVEMTFDGKTATLFGKDANLYTQIEIPGTLDHLINELRDKFNRPLPGADLLLPDVYGELIHDVVDVKDLGSGVIGGTECDHLAFRNKDVDWQIWIAQGERPYPCRYIITDTHVDEGPQYSIQISNWKTGTEVVADEYGFKNTTDAKKVRPEALPDIDELPDHFAMGASK